MPSFLKPFKRSKALDEALTKALGDGEGSVVATAAERVLRSVEDQLLTPLSLTAITDAVARVGVSAKEASRALAQMTAPNRLPAMTPDIRPISTDGDTWRYEFTLVGEHGCAPPRGDATILIEAFGPDLDGRDRDLSVVVTPVIAEQVDGFLEWMDGDDSWFEGLGTHHFPCPPEAFDVRFEIEGPRDILERLRIRLYRRGAEDDGEKLYVEWCLVFEGSAAKEAPETPVAAAGGGILTGPIWSPPGDTRPDSGSGLIDAIDYTGDMPGWGITSSGGPMNGNVISIQAAGELQVGDVVHIDSAGRATNMPSPSHLDQPVGRVLQVNGDHVEIGMGMGL